MNFDKLWDNSELKITFLFLELDTTQLPTIVPRMFAIDMRMFYVFGVLAETFYKNRSGQKRVFQPKQSVNGWKSWFLV